MQITFWGVRGSTPALNRDQWRYGGNTLCVEIRSGNTLFILDAGTGIRELGRQLLTAFASPGLCAHILLTHYHWDHIQGLPYFEPLYTYGNTFHIYGPQPQSRLNLSLQEIVESLFQPPFFPISPVALHSHRHYRELGEESFRLEDVAITARMLNHPQGCFGYRLESAAGSVVYATDHEAGFPDFDRALRELAWNADVIICDAHFLPSELSAQRRGWGHCSWADAVRIARDANAKNLVLFHYEPSRKDVEVDMMLREARRQFPNTFAASERMVLQVSEGTVCLSSRPRRLSQRRLVRRHVILEGVENSLPFSEEAWLENLSIHGAYLLSRHQLALQSRVRVVLETNKQAGNSALQLEGYVVRTETPANLNASPNVRGGIGVAVHFPGSLDDSAGN